MKDEFFSDLDHIRTNLNQAVQAGVIPKDAMKYSDEFLESLYADAFQNYRAGDWEKGAKKLRSIMALDPLNPKYPLGLATILHNTKNYPQAAIAYRLCSFLDQTNPVPHFYLADCYLKLGEKAKAATALEMALKLASDQKEFEPLAMQAKEILSSAILT